MSKAHQSQKPGSGEGAKSDTQDPLRDLLREAREFVATYVMGILETSCLLDEDLKPRRETLEDEDKAEVERAEAVLARIDAALAARSLERAAKVERLLIENEQLRRCLLPVWMGIAQADAIGEPIPDDTVVLRFMGSGASDQVTAGEIRAVLQTEKEESP